MHNAFVREYSSIKYTDVVNIPLCLRHHAILREALELPSAPQGKFTSAECQCCEDEDLTTMYLQQSEENRQG